MAAYDTLDQSPQLGDFTPLAEHNAQTPTTFFGSPPVLHLFAPASTLKIPSHDYLSHADVRKISGSSREPPPGPNPSDAADATDTVALDNVDVWVTSQSLILFSPASSFGLSIPYPTITVTAQDGADVLLELNLSDPDTADEDIDFMQLRIAATSAVAQTPVENGNGESAHGPSAATAAAAAAAALFKAISDCQELNPDPVREDGEGEDYEDETAPGATGWITSDNMADFVDADGNFRIPEGMGVVIGGEEGGEGGEGLGAGAGRTRTAAEADGSDGAAEDETKWQRTN